METHSRSEAGINTVLICNVCGALFPQSAAVAGRLIPEHMIVSCNPRDFPAAALECGAVSCEFACPGSEQNPRNSETDRRPLWKDGGVS